MEETAEEAWPEVSQKPWTGTKHRTMYESDEDESRECAKKRSCDSFHHAHKPVTELFLIKPRLICRILKPIILES